MRRKEKNGEDDSLLSFNECEEKVLLVFNSSPDAEFTYKQIFNHPEIKGLVSNELLNNVLDKLIGKSRIVIDNNSYALAKAKKTPAYNDLVEGTVDHVNARFAFIILDSTEKKIDVWVKTEDLNGAVDGDKVKVHIYNKKTGQEGSRPEGEVVEIVKRKRTEFVGKVQLSNRFAFVIPDSKKVHFDIFIHIEKLNGAQNGDKVIARIDEWHKRDKNPVGEVVTVLGKAGENNTEMHAILLEYGLPSDFPKEIEEEAAAIPTEITAEEIAKRRDFRSVTTFTIDPIDAKDFDDALSIQKLPNGNWEIGVHIADVTHYVTPGTRLEEEAYYRGTSVYLVDRCVPMLPEVLSNNLCSLRPNEDKLTFSAVFEINDQAEVQKEWFGRTVIHSDRRFSYEEVQEIIEAKEGEYYEEIDTLNKLAYILRDQRFKSGAIGFETVEVKFKLDERGKPLAVIPKVRKDAHKLIEDFMLLANKKVAEFVYNKKRPSDEHGPTMVYRVHEEPNGEKLQQFAVFAGRFGHLLKLESGNVAQSINKFITSIEGQPEENVLQNLAVRAMSKARYTTTELGHYGLAFAHYSHFTSPIRRYPDMMAHRLLQLYLDKQPSASIETVEEQCKYASDREKLAAEAERASIKYKQVEYMQLMEKRPFEGIVSGITEWGVYVEMTETKCEGLIRMVDLTDDFYEVDAKNYRVIGKRTGREISLGDTVIVTVKGTDLDKRTIDLNFEDHVSGADGKKKTPIIVKNYQGEKNQKSNKSSRGGNKRGGGQSKRRK